jgi:hypothetical protein
MSLPVHDELKPNAEDLLVFIDDTGHDALDGTDRGPGELASMPAEEAVIYSLP